MVALRKESVDRNEIRITPIDGIIGSLSARRAWIEIHSAAIRLAVLSWSLSARRAWIEISGRSVEFHLFAWSLSARRAWIEMRPLVLILRKIGGRSPQGERG